MLTARKSRWFEAVFGVYNRNLLRRRFSSLRVLDLDTLSPNDSPTIVFANHSSWWDGLVCWEMIRQAGADPFVMMEEKNLRRYPLFRRLGAFSVDRGNARSALASIGYAADLLTDSPERALLVFPQGRIEPAGRRPIVFESGIARIAKRVPGCRLVPVALNYEFTGEFKPEIFVRCGEAFPAGAISVPEMSVRLEELLARQQSDIAAGSLGGYRRAI